MEQHLAQALRERPAQIDPLTRLPNRLEFLDELGATLMGVDGSEGSVAVFFVDLDGFRGVNRDRGHGVGDELLFAAARRIVSAAGAGDVVARAGGDEFAVMSCDLEDSGAVAAFGNRLLAAFDDPFDLGDELLHCTVSIGVAVSNNPECHAESLVGDAEAALERVPEGARRFELFDAELRERIRARNQLGIDIAEALRVGDISLAYQPIVDIASGRIVAIEALSRWQHRDRGHVSPELFVRVADETGRSEQLLHAVLERAAADFVPIAAADPQSPISLAVNVSPSQLRSSSLIAGVSRLIEGCGVPADRVVIEISEAALSGGPELYLRRVSELRALGVRISLDDFGTASTSIAQLRALPIDQIKLDRSFVSGLGEGTADAALAAGLLPMARALGIEVVAEGIETDQQLAHLFALGYRQGQGYRFAVAVPPAEVAALIARGPLSAVHLPDIEAESTLRLRFQDALLAGDAKRAEAIVAEAVAAGLGAMTIQTEIIGRALHWVDTEWEAGRLDAADEHLASAICERQLATVFDSLQARRRRPRFARRVLLAAIQGEGDEAALKVAADVLHAAGYETVFLGTDVPAHTLEAATGTHRPRAVCLNVPADRSEGADADLEATIERISAIEEPPLVLVGGEGIRRADPRRDGAIAVSSPQDALEVLAEQLSA